MRCCPPLKGLQSIKSTFPFDDIDINNPESLSCRFMQQLRNEEIEFYEKHLWFQNFNLRTGSSYSNANSSNINNVGIEESERIREIQRRIAVLQEGNDLLMSYIRQLYHLSQSPTKADLDYLNHLFRVDKENLNELSESLMRGKNVIDRTLTAKKTEEELRVKPFSETCNYNCNVQCKCKVWRCNNVEIGKEAKDNWIKNEYVIVGEKSCHPKPSTSRKETLKKERKVGECTLCPYLKIKTSDVDEFAPKSKSNDLFEMEKGLEEMQERMASFKEASTDIKEWCLLHMDKNDVNPAKSSSSSLLHIHNGKEEEFEKTGKCNSKMNNGCTIF